MGQWAHFYESNKGTTRRFESQTKEQLTAAGFFYTGRGDSTTCYHCGLSLKKPVDIPWNQHAKWFPGCLFFHLSRERAFIDDFSGALFPSSSTRRKLSPIIKKLRNFTPLPQEDNGKLNHLPLTNKIIENSRLCRICFDEEIGVVFLPCGHLITCIKCAPNLKVCPFCQSHLTMVTRVYFSLLLHKLKNHRDKSSYHWG
ncbi:hypothetical protein QAD02_007333 [Eretmocerus hayati]|uniref:Uncharacterized protein n=1 Tax=Eretmocerus hayati TaxID=131215 RepID=A0ACC2N471_9HYME|nr:hypothetical protein QAD02_007333 [Eretmocerus hayati]